MLPLTASTQPRDQGQSFAAQLGALAADQARVPPGLPSRLPAVLDRLRQQARTRYAHETFRANHFIMGD
jgi:hypothetical protein